MLRTAEVGPHPLTAFSIYLRTGRRVVADDVEVKFNPWHDSDDGRFTFVGGGRHFSSGSRSGNWRGSGFHGGGGGRTGGGGATGSWESPPPSRRLAPKSPSPAAASGLPRRVGLGPVHAAEAAIEQPHLSVHKNGYQFRVDAHVRARRVSGQLQLGATEGRSRSAQAQAGGKDRRRTDDGGHYIAARFNGPRDAFNHFAQDANFNRGKYRALEDSWARSIRSGHKVFVDIVPHYTGESQRPDKITVIYFVDQKRRRAEFPNGK